MALAFALMMVMAAAVAAIGIVLMLERGYYMLMDAWAERGGEYHSED